MVAVVPTFKTLSVANAALTFILFCTLLFAPGLIFWTFSIQAGAAAIFIARRAAILFLGLSLISYGGRNAPHSDLRQSIVLGMFVLWALMACLGIFEFARGYAGIGILLAVVAELGFALGYWFIWKSNRRS